MQRFAVLSICTANICRSPMMEMLLRIRLDPEVFEVASAGVRGWDGQPMNIDAESELKRLGGDAARFRSRPVTAPMATAADLILTATRDQRSAVLEMNPGSLRRAFTLLEFAALIEHVHPAGLDEVVRQAARERSLGPKEADILDPYLQPIGVHATVADQIDAAVARIAAVLNRVPRAGPLP